MPLAPQFMPEGNTAEGIQAGQSNAQSLMDRADQQRIRDAQEQRAQQLNEILTPVRQAQSLADIATAHAAISTATRMQGLRAQAAIAAGPANDEFLAAQSWDEPLNDVPASDDTPEGNAIQDKQRADATQAMWDGRAQRLAQLQAKYSWMAQIPEYKGFVDAVNEARIQTHGSALANLHLTEQLAQAQAAVEGRKAVAGVMAGSRQGVADTNAAARTATADTAANSRVEAATIGAGARVESAKARQDHTYEFEKTKALYDHAVETGDKSGEVLFGQRLQKMNTVSGEPVAALPTPSAHAAAAPATAPAAVAPPVVRTVEVGGAHYPVFTNKVTGQKGYMKDGKIVPIAAPAAAEEPAHDETPVTEPE